MFLLSFQTKADKVEMTTADVSVWGEQEDKPLPCIMEEKDTYEGLESFTCEIQSPPSAHFKKLMLISFFLLTAAQHFIAHQKHQMYIRQNSCICFVNVHFKIQPSYL